MFVCYVIYGQTKYSAVTSLILYSVSVELIDFLSLLSFLLCTFILRFSPLKKKKIIFTFLYSPALFPLSSVLPAVEGQWLEWGPWSRCSVTCNTGTQQRQRRCSSSVHGWAECKGLHQESRECTNPSCSGEERRSVLCIQTHKLSKKKKKHYANMGNAFEAICMVRC